MPTTPSFSLLTTARNRLLGLRLSDGGWGYRPGSPTSAVEPSALASLALLATAPAGAAEARRVPVGAARWIADHARRPDGSTAVAATSTPDAPGWTTPFALLLWSALGEFEFERRAATRWLLASKGKPGEPVPHNPMGHDVTLVGWPWVADTHSWVEPTAASLLALAPSVAVNHPRMVEGVRVLRDRAIPGGGWNLGNPVVFGQVFRPLPAPTGLALLALARVPGDSRSEAIISRAVSYLEGVARTTSAPSSLGWATLGLRAWDVALDAGALGHLHDATDRALARAASASELALLVLAASDRSLAVLGITPRTEGGTAR